MTIVFTAEQQAYIDSSLSENIYLSACPGSGKTEVISAKVAKEIKNWNQAPAGIAVFSFTNSATNELKEKITQRSYHNLFPHLISTFDSFILNNIIHPYSYLYTGFEGRDKDYSVQLVENTANLYIQTKYSYARRGKIKACQYYYCFKQNRFIFNTGDRSYNNALEKITPLKDWQEKDLFKAKCEFYRKGYATYQDIEYIALQLLEKNKNIFTNLVLRYPYLIIDECQDLSYNQLLILKFLSNYGCRIHLIGDLNQSIYEFRDADPNEVSNFIDEVDFKKMCLSSNFRSGQSIVDLCNKLIGAEATVEQKIEDSRCLLFEYNKCPSEILPLFKEVTKNYSNNVIVGRGHSVLEKLRISGIGEQKGKPKNIAHSIILFDKNNLDKLEQSLLKFSNYLLTEHNKTVKPYSFNCPVEIESSLEWRLFLFKALEYLVVNNLTDFTLTWSQWIRKLKTHLAEILEQGFITEEIKEMLSSLTNPTIRAPSGEARDLVDKSYNVEIGEPLQYKLTTIHQVKGQTHDATMLVSTPDARGGGGGHWKHWLKDLSSENARLAYVASSRPKHLLIWAVKELNSNDKKTLKSLGFHIRKSTKLFK